VKLLYTRPIVIYDNPTKSVHLFHLHGLFWTLFRDEELREDPPPKSQRKYLVYESCLRSLLAICTLCMLPCRVFIKRQQGTMVYIDAVCDRGHVRSWASQPFMGKLACRNLETAAAILFSACMPTKALNLMKHLKMPTMTHRTYLSIQRFYLLPSVYQVWSAQQRLLIAALKMLPARLGGDARCDSPGHNAKYGSYSLMDLRCNTVVDLQLIQVNMLSHYNRIESAIYLQKCTLIYDDLLW
jgi:hypothetical protein